MITDDRETMTKPWELPQGTVYTGVGSRETPGDVLALIEQIARRLYWRAFNVRTGGAAVEMASRFHPNWPACSSAVRALHARLPLFAPLGVGGGAVITSSTRGARTRCPRSIWLD